MKDMWNTSIVGERVVLVPYRREHVPTYNRWLRDPYIQEMTASEEVTLDEEYAMQQTWHDDATKLIFIILDKSIPDDQAIHPKSALNYAMAGDVDLFLGQEENEDTGVNVKTGELNIMIAEDRSRRKGLAKEATLLMMNYAVRTQGVEKFVAKISETNTPSIALFKSLGFVEVNTDTAQKLANTTAHARETSFEQ